MNAFTALGGRGHGDMYVRYQNKVCSKATSVRQYTESEDLPVHKMRYMK